jgi:CRISPR-associated protein Cmx8
MSDCEIELSYDPFALPTAQHRAGLAGLRVLIESMRRRRIEPLPELSINNDGRATLRFTEESLQNLFDDLYDAGWDDRRSNEKPQGKKIRNVRRIEMDESAPTTNRRRWIYTFEAVAPKGAFLRALGMPDPWLKLWREAIWYTLCGGSPQTRIPYEQRAEGKHVKKAEDAWEDLQKFRQAKAKNRLHCVRIAGSLFIGAQAENAERVPFQGRADEAFLLRFWPVVMGLYRPETIDREGQTKFVGYVLAVPEVSDLEGFVQVFPDTIASLGNEMIRFGLPREAVISLPQEGGLEYMHHLMSLARAKAQRGETAHNVAAIEVYHLKPPDYTKNERMVRIIGADRVTAATALLEKYEAIRGHYHDPLFKRQIILNLLLGEPWHGGFDCVFAQNDFGRFIGSQAERFSRDARRYFETAFQARRSA